MTARSRHRSILFAGLALGLGLLCAEGVLRLYSVIGGEVGRGLARRDPLAVRFVPHGEFGYRQQANGTQPYPNGTRARWNELGYRGPAVSLAKPDDTFRVVLLGGSTTHGYGVDNDQTIDAHMRRMLAERYPDRRFEVVNLALGGYDSYQVFERMRTDGTGLSPDLVIVNSGINDVRNSVHTDIEPADPRTLLWETNMSAMRREMETGRFSLSTRLKHYLYLARLPGYIRSRMRIAPQVEEARTAVPKPDAIDYFADNIVKTADLARGTGAQLILSTPPSSLSTRYAPGDVSHIGYWIVDAKTTQDYRDRLAARMERLAGELSRPGEPVAYVSAEPPPQHFIDDCHLTGEGNRDVAEALVEAMAPLVSTPRLGSAKAGRINEVD